MTVARVAVCFAGFASFVGCSLFSDLGGYSEEPPTAVSDSGADVDATIANDGSSGPPDAPAPIDAGPDGSAYKQAVLADQPMAYWPFDEGAGSSFARDIIGGKNAALVGAVTFGKPGVDGTAVERSSGGGNFDVGDFFDLAGTQPYTIELWGWPKGTGQYENILYKRRQDFVGWIVYFSAASQDVSIEQRYAAGQRVAYAPLPDGAKTKFHHIVFVFDPVDPTDKRMRLYIDNVRTNGFSDDGAADDTSQSLGMMDFVGLLDEVALYDHALTTERIDAHYKLGPK